MTGPTALVEGVHFSTSPSVETKITGLQPCASQNNHPSAIFNFPFPWQPVQVTSIVMTSQATAVHQIQAFYYMDATIPLLSFPVTRPPPA